MYEIKVKNGDNKTIYHRRRLSKSQALRVLCFLVPRFVRDRRRWDTYLLKYDKKIYQYRTHKTGKRVGTATFFLWDGARR